MKIIYAGFSAYKRPHFWFLARNQPPGFKQINQFLCNNRLQPTVKLIITSTSGLQNNKITYMHFVRLVLNSVPHDWKSWSCTMHQLLDPTSHPMKWAYWNFYFVRLGFNLIPLIRGQVVIGVCTVHNLIDPTSQPIKYLWLPTCIFCVSYVLII